ncbi:MAG: ribulose-phosphate 3-epimerase [Bacteroidales bacterium]|nr:ribulose-phosphate 3-epimerase [Bacteroidales bacterium]
MSVLIAPSVLSADFLYLDREIQMLNESEADWIHVDVMDGSFVPNISFGLPIVNALYGAAEKPLDVHLMINSPDCYLEKFAQAGATWMSVHYEACTHLHRSIQTIRDLQCYAGVVLNPHTPVHLLEDILPELDYVLLMSVNPGYGGQKFIPQTLEKIRKMKKMIETINPDCLIEVDGGISLTNAADIIAAGADVLVAGNAVFKNENPKQVISDLKKIG